MTKVVPCVPWMNISIMRYGQSQVVFEKKNYVFWDKAFQVHNLGPLEHGLNLWRFDETYFLFLHINNWKYMDCELLWERPICVCVLFVLNLVFQLIRGPRKKDLTLWTTFYRFSVCHLWYKVRKDNASWRLWNGIMWLLDNISCDPNFHHVIIYFFVSTSSIEESLGINVQENVNFIHYTYINLSINNLNDNLLTCIASQFCSSLMAKHYS
jgi:hypothetical protein